MSEHGTGKPRVALLFNILAPYRIPVFRSLAEQFDLTLILSGTEDNRKWEQLHVAGLRTKRAFGWTRKGRAVSSEGRTAEQKYLHINPGYVVELLRLRPQAVVSTEMGFRSLQAVIYGWLFRVPVWIWWEGGRHSATTQSSSRLRRGLRRYFFARYVQNWFSFGTVSSEYLRSLGVPRHRITQVQLPVDESLFGEDVQGYELSVPHPRALYVGRLIDNKGIFQLLDATSRIQRKGIDCSLVIVGDGPEAERVEHMISALSLQNIEWLKWISPENMPRMYRACDFLVFPTLDDVWGLVVNEAILSGIPIIASEYAGCANELLPETNIFNPLVPGSLQSLYEQALLGAVPKQDKEILQPVANVADTIAQQVLTGLRAKP